MEDHPNLKPGSFYWVLPVYDVDFTPDRAKGIFYGDDTFDFDASYHHWTQSEQPARFDGYTVDGQEKWIYLGHDVDETNWWPVRWIGDEIVMPILETTP